MLEAKFRFLRDVAHFVAAKLDIWPDMERLIPRLSIFKIDLFGSHRSKIWEGGWKVRESQLLEIVPSGRLPRGLCTCVIMTTYHLMLGAWS